MLGQRGAGELNRGGEECEVALDRIEMQADTSALVDEQPMVKVPEDEGCLRRQVRAA